MNFFLETIAAKDLESGRLIQLMEQMSKEGM